MNPLSTKRNKYHSNIKNSTVFTPPGVAQFIYDKAVFPLYCQNRQKTKTFIVLDPAIGGGNLVKPLEPLTKSKKAYIIGYDIDNYNPEPCDVFFQENFMDVKRVDAPVSLAIVNPPFNTDERNREWLKKHKKGKALIPEVFVDKLSELYPKVPIIMIVPMGFLLNQRKKSNRWKKYSRTQDIKISSILMLPLDAFPGVEFHCCVVCFNFPEGLLEPFYWFEEKYL